jgi:2-phosphosulfolactate phosphatase
MPKIHVCLTPALINLFDLSNKRVVVTDVLRATSAMVTGLAHGVQCIRPVSTADEAKRREELGYQGAAERDGKVVEGFSFGNSPFAYMGEEVKGKKIALTTTNGTKAIQLSEGALEILAAGFVNLDSTVAYCAKFQEDVLVHCAGWKDQFNIEDTLFAGAMVFHLEKEGFHCADDAGMAAKMLYEQTKGDLFGFLKNSSHYHRLARLGIEKDIEYCLKENQLDVVGVIRNGELVNA